MKTNIPKVPELSPDEVYLNNLISKGENQVLDFKYAINDSRKIARSLVAFANTDGGRLLIGVKDNGIVSGVRSDEELYMVDTANMLYCEPEVSIVKNMLIYNGKEVLEVVIRKRVGHRLHTVKEENGKDLVYIRIGSSNQLVNHIWMRIWAIKNNEKNILKAELRENEMNFLKLFSDAKSYKIEEIAAQIKLPKKLCEHFLIKFGALDLIQVDFRSNGVYYRQNSKNEKF
ncbi:MAG: ATP-binding protein [Bacteroidales bacterium]|nr:ATP-binding protein [Bacteroidales bacterium]